MSGACLQVVDKTFGVWLSLLQPGPQESPCQTSNEPDTFLCFWFKKRKSFSHTSKAIVFCLFEMFVFSSAANLQNQQKVDQGSSSPPPRSSGNRFENLMYHMTLRSKNYSIRSEDKLRAQANQFESIASSY